MFRLFVGIGTDRSGKAIPASHVDLATDRILKQACTDFGGATITKGEGIWLDSGTEILHREQCLIIDVGTQDVAAVDQLAAFARDILHQSSVAVQHLSPAPLQFV